MPDDPLTSQMLVAIENELMTALAVTNQPEFQELHAMMSYHLGWDGDSAGVETRGKRIRPLLVLLTCAAAGVDWEIALPAAASVELIHNFSLIHDDIEDNSPLRRGRPTVWSRWGVPQAINTGDAMFTLAHLAILRLEQTTTPGTALEASKLLHETCLQLTQGQYLDIAYEGRSDMSEAAYWPMVTGKTAILLSACSEIGALAAGANLERRTAYRQFGRALGLAFQVIDDLLGIWGDEAITGKSAGSDLVSGKKSLPVVYGLGKGGKFATLWKQGPITPADVREAAALLEAEGGREYTQARADELTRQALAALEQAQPVGRAGFLLRELAAKLLARQA